MKKKTIKAWAISNSTAPVETGGGQFFVFSEEELAKKGRFGILKRKNYQIIPCTITYALHKK